MARRQPLRRRHQRHRPDRPRPPAGRGPRRLGRHRQFAAVVVSPVRRAVETAQPAAHALGRRMRVVDELREVDFGVAEGRTSTSCSTSTPRWCSASAATPSPTRSRGPRRPRLAAARAAGALRDVAAAHPGGRVLVVAHNTLLRIALCALLDVPVARYRSLFPACATRRSPNSSCRWTAARRPCCPSTRLRGTDQVHPPEGAHHEIHEDPRRDGGAGVCRRPRKRLCHQVEGRGSSGGNTKNAKIAFLMPDTASTRYEQHDRPASSPR